VLIFLEDGQGCGIGGYLIKRLNEVCQEKYAVVALGTNEVAIAPPSGQADYRKTKGVF